MRIFMICTKSKQYSVSNRILNFPAIHCYYIYSWFTSRLLYINNLTIWWSPFPVYLVRYASNLLTVKAGHICFDPCVPISAVGICNCNLSNRLFISEKNAIIKYRTCLKRKLENFDVYTADTYSVKYNTVKVGKYIYVNQGYEILPFGRRHHSSI